MEEFQTHLNTIILVMVNEKIALKTALPPYPSALWSLAAALRLNAEKIMITINCYEKKLLPWLESNQRLSSELLLRAYVRYPLHGTPYHWATRQAILRPCGAGVVGLAKPKELYRMPAVPSYDRRLRRPWRAVCRY